VIDLLKQEGLPVRTAVVLADRWLTQGDFLLASLDGQFDFVVGNPPYREGSGVSESRRFWH